MNKHTQLRTRTLTQYCRARYSNQGGTFAFLATLAALLAIVGLSSCAGLTSAGTPGGGTPGSSGAGVLTPSASTLSFGSLAVGSNATQTLTFTNTGTGTVNIASANISGAGFTAVGGSPLSAISVGQSGTIQIQFAPPSAGAVTGSLSIASDAANSPLTVSLTGTGTQAGLTISPASLNFGNVTVGQSSAQSVKLTNSGNVNVVVNLATLTGSGFSMSGLSLPATLTASQSLNLNVQFAPTTGGGVAGSIVFTDNAPGSPQTLSLSGSGVAANATLIANPGSFAFGNVVVGSTASQTFTLSNSGNTSIVISQASVSGTGFAISGLTTPKTILAGQNTTFTGQFTPTATGNASGTMTISSNATNPTVTIPLSGIGTQGKLSANPANVSFGSLVTGASASVAITLTNTGTANVVVSSGSVSGTGFSISGLATPVTLSPAQGTSFTAKFAPTSTGTFSGSISITSNAPNSPLTIGLSGTGTAPPQPQLTINPTNVNFNNVNVGSNGTATITLSNPGNANTVISQATASGSGFSLSGLALPTTIAAGGSTSFTATFAPTTKGSASGTISITSNAPGSPASVTLSGTGVQPQLTPSPTSINFGSVVTGNSNSQIVTLTNGGNASLTITQANVTGAGFSSNGLSLPQTIAAGGNTTFNVVFAPTSAGSASGSVSLVSNAPNSPLAIPLSGIGTAATAALTATPNNLPFGSVNVNGSSSLTTTLKNTGNSNVTISNVTFPAGGFTGSGVSSGLILTPNQTAVLTVTFAPTASGAVGGNVSIASNATGSPTTVSVSGTGVSQSTHTVGLTWDASSSTGVTGYFVYRGTTTGGPYTKQNSSPDASLTYTDSSLLSGLTYFYVVTAVDSNNVESAFSNEASVPVP
ncbi:MAG: beta strand repeat-containing protein [Candidatus Acidiferrales bacterium]